MLKRVERVILESVKYLLGPDYVPDTIVHGCFHLYGKAEHLSIASDTLEAFQYILIG